MCLAVPAKLVSRSGSEALADLHGNRVQISTMLVPDAIPGDWVLVHAGFAIQRVSDEDVRQTWEILKDMERASEGRGQKAEGRNNGCSSKILPSALSPQPSSRRTT